MLLSRLLIILALNVFTTNASSGPTNSKQGLSDVASSIDDVELLAPSFGSNIPFPLQNDRAIPVFNGSGPITLGTLLQLIFPMWPQFLVAPWTGQLPMRDSDQYCWYPHNPDIAGIGVRITLYIQSLVVVVLLLVSRFRQRSPPDSLSGMHRVQVYTVIAFVIAGLAERSMDQLSLFHETIVAHLAFMSISSAWIGVPASAEEPGDRWLGPGLSEYPRLAYIFRMVNWLNPSGSLLLGLQFAVKEVVIFGLDGASMMMMLFVVHALAMDFTQKVETCYPDAGEPWSSRGDLKWLVDRVLVLKWVLFVVLGFLFAVIFYRMFPFVLPKVLKKWKLEQRVIQLGVVAFFTVWVWEVLSIEQSLRTLPYFHSAEEEQWGFGQIFPLILLLPLGEAIFDVLLDKAEENSSAANIQRQHREACAQTDCDVQLIYDRENIHCGFHLAPYIGHLVATVPASVYAIVTDTNVAPLHLATLKQQLMAGSPKATIFTFTAPHQENPSLSICVDWCELVQIS